MNQEERERRAAYARVRASSALEGMQLTRDKETALEPYFRGEISLDELTKREITRWTNAPR